MRGLLRTAQAAITCIHPDRQPQQRQGQPPQAERGRDLASGNPAAADEHQVGANHVGQQGQHHPSVALLARRAAAQRHGQQGEGQCDQRRGQPAMQLRLCLGPGITEQLRGRHQLRIVLGTGLRTVGQGHVVAREGRQAVVQPTRYRALHLVPVIQLQEALAGAFKEHPATGGGHHFEAVVLLPLQEHPAQPGAIGRDRGQVDHAAIGQRGEAARLQAGHQHAAVGLDDHLLCHPPGPGPQPQRAGTHQGHDRQHQHQQRPQQTLGAHAHGGDDRHFRVPVQAGDRQQQAQHQRQRQDQRQVGDELQAQLREQQLGRQAPIGDVAEDVHQHAAHADHQQDDQGSQETLDEIAQQVSVELQHGAVV